LRVFSAFITWAVSHGIAPAESGKHNAWVSVCYRARVHAKFVELNETERSQSSQQRVCNAKNPSLSVDNMLPVHQIDNNRHLLRPTQGLGTKHKYSHPLDFFFFFFLLSSTHTSILRSQQITSLVSSLLSSIPINFMDTLTLSFETLGFTSLAQLLCRPVRTHQNTRPGLQTSTPPQSHLQIENHLDTLLYIKAS
jgi:hypothetical protein